MTNIQLRRVWFQVHKWIGLVLAVLVIPLSLSGSALVWHDALDRIVNPQRYATSGTQLLPLDRYASAARAALMPGERIQTVSLPEGSGPIVVAAATDDPRQAGPPTRTLFYLDPPSARLLDRASSNAGLMRTVHVLHGSLLVPSVGRTIVGWLGIAMLISSLTGLWLWWPTVGRWTRGLRWQRHRNVDSNLHHLFGFWTAPPLFVLSLTGAWIAFPAVFGALVGEHGERRPPFSRSRPLLAPAQPLAVVAMRARTILPGQVRSITWPTETSPDWTVALTRGDGPLRTVKVSDDTGTATAARARETAGVARLMRRIHDGDGMGLAWQLVIFVGGLLPTVLAVTGLIMWWRARRWRSAVAGKRATTG